MVDLNIPGSVEATSISYLSGILEGGHEIRPMQTISHLFVRADSMRCYFQRISGAPLRWDAQLSTGGKGIVGGGDACDARPFSHLLRSSVKTPDPVYRPCIAVNSRNIKLNVVRYFELNTLFGRGRSGYSRC